MNEFAVRTRDLWKVFPQEPEPVEAVRGVRPGGATRRVRGHGWALRFGEDDCSQPAR